MYNIIKNITNYPIFEIRIIYRLKKKTICPSNINHADYYYIFCTF